MLSSTSDIQCFENHTRWTSKPKTKQIKESKLLVI